MSRVSSKLSRSLLVVTVLLTLIAPSVQAAQRVDDPAPGTRVIRRVIGVIKHLLPSILGDMLSEPKP